jgi:hypothetical protein
VLRRAAVDSSPSDPATELDWHGAAPNNFMSYPAIWEAPRVWRRVRVGRASALRQNPQISLPPRQPRCILLAGIRPGIPSLVGLRCIHLDDRPKHRIPGAGPLIADDEYLA